MRQRVRLATHSSPLALKYAAKVAESIQQLQPHIAVDLIRVPTRSDRYYYERPAEIGGRCLYLDNVLQAVQQGSADIAVHVIEESPHGKVNWPRGWLSIKCEEDEGTTIHVFPDPKHIPQRFWEIGG